MNNVSSLYKIIIRVAKISKKRELAKSGMGDDRMIELGNG